MIVQCVTQSADAAKVNLGKHPVPVSALRSSQLGGDVSTLLPVRSTAALTVRHTLLPTRPTDGALPGLANPGETDS